MPRLERARAVPFNGTPRDCEPDRSADTLSQSDPAPGRLSHNISDDAGPTPLVVAYGMGVDSTAMLIGLQRRRLRPDLILFADTGSEKPETYAYRPIIDEWLTHVGFPTVTVLHRESPRAGDKSLFGECHRKSVLPSLAYGGHSCSLKWKVEPQWKYCKDVFGWNSKTRSWAHGQFIRKMIGYNAGPADQRRVKNAIGKWPPGHKYEYPLVDWGWERPRCEAEIVAAGLPLPIKSACFFCPASKKPELDWLAEHHPELAAQALELEERAHRRGLTSVVGLGRRFSWTEYLHDERHNSERARRPPTQAEAR